MTEQTPFRLTKATQAVIEALMNAEPDDPTWGLRICQEADLGPGTVYPILERMAERGWVTVKPEDGKPSGRPRRLFYELNCMGVAAIADLQQERRKGQRRWRPVVAFGDVVRG